ncbi:hypothetical protein AB6A40_008651 [Gnathostoma spinigerum]|uniref:Uncharacterized protein n=1 Tax=Gnathostoma spinigerum TaxID=75299 RepID=A0ABD6ES22_9BILA
MSRVPLLARLDYSLTVRDQDWITHILPKDSVVIPREHIPELNSENLPSSFRRQMGNGQSAGNVSGSSFSRNKEGIKSKRFNGVVVVSSGADPSNNPAEDEHIKRLKVC